MQAPSRWVVTGGSGFLATNFLRALTPEDGEVVAISRHQPRWPVLRAGIRYAMHDVRDVEAYRNELIPGSVVVHMASSSYPGKAEKVIESDIQDNVLGSIRLAQACADQGVRALLFLSSGGSVYGNAPMSPIPEEAPTQPISAYGAMKLTIEHYLQIISHLRGLPVASLRVANPFGPFHDGERQGAINVFFNKVRQGALIEIWGDGEQVRDFISVEDVASAIRAIGLGFESGAESFNIGVGRGRSIKNILEQIELVSGLVPRIQHMPARPVDVQSNVLDCSKLRRRFGWEPIQDFDKAVQATWEWTNRELVK
jgi:UDP-glucose 4-epimerase